MLDFYQRALPVAMSLVAYNSLFTGFFIILKRHDVTGLQYLISNLFIFGWAMGFSFTFNENMIYEKAVFWGWFTWFCFMLMPVSWLHFVLAYTRQVKKYLWELLLSYGVIILYLVLGGGHQFVMSLTARAGGRFYAIPGPAFVALAIVFVTVTIYAFIILGEYWHREQETLKKDDARFFFITQAFGYGLSAICLLPCFGIDFPQYQLLALPLWQFLLAYAMIRHYLLDSEAFALTLHRDRLASMSTVTASMHHELRNPLTAIKTFAEYLPKKYDDPEFRKKFSKIVSKEVARVNELLKQLLEFSKPRQAKLKWGNIQSVIEEIFQFMEGNLERHHIKVEKEWGESVEILFDDDQMRQVFLNIIMNAIQAMPKGGTLHIRTGFDKKQNYIIQVADTGKGMTPEQVKKIKDPFFTTKEKGSGLGLPIVEQILQKHHATLEIFSELNKGTLMEIAFRKVRKNS